MLTLVSNCIDRLNVYNSAAHFGECAGSEAGAAWKDILNLLYELLGKELVYTTHTRTCTRAHTRTVYVSTNTHSKVPTVINHRDKSRRLRIE